MNAVIVLTKCLDMLDEFDSDDDDGQEEWTNAQPYTYWICEAKVAPTVHSQRSKKLQISAGRI